MYLKELIDKNMNLKDLIKNREDIKFSDIPVEFQNNFDNFMFGQTYYKDEKGNDMCYFHDFMRWYYQNQKELDTFFTTKERDEKLDKILK